jgi:hypothetical protein
VDCNHRRRRPTTPCDVPQRDQHRELPQPIIPPDPNNSWNGGTNIDQRRLPAAAGYVPTGAAVITYDIKSVETWDDAG